MSERGGGDRGTYDLGDEGQQTELLIIKTDAENLRFENWELKAGRGAG